MAAKAAGAARVRKTRPRWVRVTKKVFAWLALLFLIVGSVLGVMFVRELKTASELLVTLPDKLRTFSMQPTKVISADGKVLATFQTEFREPITYDQIPKRVRDAIVAAEDKRFFDHRGVDYWAMARVLAVGAREGRFSQGGSTLTMQLAKRFYSSGERTFSRKLQDVALAITMERDLTKEQILTLYLNTVYFGEKAYGIQAAADVYFGKPINKLTVAEAALLARCVRRPSDENPVKNLDKAVENRNVVLAIMRDEGMITQTEYDAAIAEKVHLLPAKERAGVQNNQAPYFVAHVLDTLDQDFPDVDFKSGGYTIYTTLDSGLEKYAEKEVKSFISDHLPHINTAAFVLMDQQGRILAEVGGLDFRKDQFNIVTQGRRQPGSSFKPFLYYAALSTGAISPDERIENRPWEYPMGRGAKPWYPQNTSRRENSGPVGIEEALARSLNIPATHVMLKTGPQTVAAIAHDVFGFTSHLAAVPSMALGAVEVRPIEMAEAYSVFMLHGDRATPFPITKVVGPDGTILREYGPNIKRNVGDPAIADRISDCLRSVVEWGTGTAAGDVPNARGKTGTTSDNKDAWFCGYSDGLVGVAWVAHIRKKVSYTMGSSVYGGNSAAMFWQSIMLKAHDKFAKEVPSVPQVDGDAVFAEPKEPEQSPTDEVKVTPPSPPADGTTGGDGMPVGAPTTGDGTKPPPDKKPGDPGKPPDPTRGRTDSGGDKASDTVEVEVCAESGMRATIYCPETIVRKFKKGQEPRRRCSIHGG